MKYLSVGLLVVLTSLLVYTLDRPLHFGSTSLPPIGQFLSPYIGYAQSAEQPSDHKNITYEFDQLTSSVQVIFDSLLVPHIYAENDLDAYFVQGFIQAQNRLWQMDMSTRAAGGRLAEILGQRLADRDRLQRRKGFLWAAEKALEVWNQDIETQQATHSFVSGVNTYIEQLADKDLPIEYKLLHFKPEKWNTLRLALYLKSMEQSLNSYEVDLEATNAVTWLGQDLYSDLFDSINPTETPVIPTKSDWQHSSKATLTSSSEKLGYVPYQPFAKSSKHNGSNNWAVSPNKTKSGHPILCNDPHLSLTLPSIWYQVHLSTPSHNVQGVTLPGIPGVIIGFNDHVAWGMTNVGQDVADWYAIKWEDSSKTHYLYDDQYLPVIERIEQIEVLGKATIYDTVSYTRWGPIVHESVDHPLSDLAYRWVAHDPGIAHPVRAILKLNRAKSYEDYLEATRTWQSPAQNIIFASQSGDIALQVTGNFPIKNPGQGQFILDGSSRNSDWQGYIPFVELAREKNPQRLFVSSANQRSTGKEFPYAYHGGFSNFRGRILNRLLAEKQNLTADSMMALQQNVYSLKAEEILPLMLESMEGTKLGEIHRQVIETLSSWDYMYEQDQLAPIYFDIWDRAFYRLTWDEFYIKNEENQVQFPEAWKTIWLALENPAHEVFDVDSTEQVENARDVIRMSFEHAVTKIIDLEVSKWSEYSNLSINHMANIPAFGSGYIETNGHKNVLNATMGARKHGPSWRMIVELGSKPQGYGIYPGGQSGNPSSKYYKNMIPQWAEGSYIPLVSKPLTQWTSEEFLYRASYEPR